MATDEEGKIMAELVPVRYRQDFETVSPEQVDYVQLSPVQVISVAASLIPFLEHDDACLLYTSPSPRDRTRSRMPSSA